MAAILEDIVHAAYASVDQQAIEDLVATERGIILPFNELVAADLTAAAGVGAEVTAGVSAAFEVLIGVTIVLAVLACLDIIIWFAWMLRNLLRNVPLHAGYPLAGAIDYFIAFMYGIVNPLNNLVTDSVQGIGSALLTIFHFFLRATHTPTIEHVHYAAQQATSPLSQTLGHVEQLVSQIHQFLLNQGLHIASQVHALWSRLSDIEKWIDWIQHVVTALQTTVAKLVHVVADMQVQISAIIKHLLSLQHEVNLLTRQVHVLENEVNTIQKELHTLRARVVSNEFIIAPSLEAVASLSLLMPLLSAGEDGIRCLQQLAQDCKGPENRVHREECFLDNLTRIAERVSHGI